MSELSPYLKLVAQQIDGMIDRHFAHAPGELYKASSHLLSAGGKRLRPAVVLLSADAVRYGSSKEITPAALALEITHTFTLIHDDIMDGDSLRRGVPTVHSKWDMPTGILAGDVLYAKAFEFICQVKAGDGAKVSAVALLARACADICEGQHMDMSFEHRTDVTEEEYMEMVGKKTGCSMQPQRQSAEHWQEGTSARLAHSTSSGSIPALRSRYRTILSISLHLLRKAGRIRDRISGKENRL